jgi:hypothetical protein
MSGTSPQPTSPSGVRSRVVPWDVGAMPGDGSRADAMLDFLICWHLASGAEVRPQVMAALRRRAAVPDHLGGERSGPRLWSWCTSAWLPGWMRAAGLREEARALQKGGGAMVAGGLDWLRGRRPSAGPAVPPWRAP